jgi:hypothetical protein
MLNPTLGQADFYKLRKSDQNGFKKVRVVTVPAKTLLFKMTKGAAAAGQYGVTPWWSAVKPFLEDKEGALGRFQQAKSNGIDMTAMVRFMSCVCLDWNDLDNYVQVELVEEARVLEIAAAVAMLCRLCRLIGRADADRFGHSSWSVSV